MKNLQYLISLILFTGMLSMISCNRENIEDYAGNWEAESSDITVRTQDSGGNYHFTSGTAAVSIEIFSNNTASGYIGTASFEGAKVKKNSGNPEKKGLAFKVECGKIGKIFPDDPLDSKEVQIWIGPLRDDTLDS